MAWIVGIDEAGYGPNLGPLIMSSVTCRVPQELAGADLWEVLQSAVRRHPSEADGRILIEDSKLVYSTTRGLIALETGVLATLTPPGNGEPLTLSRYLDWLCPTHRDELGGEGWYHGTSALPVQAEPLSFAEARARFKLACSEKQVIRGMARSVIVLLEQWGSKGAVLGHGLAELVRCNHEFAAGTEPVHFFVDKHGGRNTYAAMLQEAVPGGMVVAHEEGMDRSVYSVLGFGQEMRLTFQPRADSEHFCVALASMISKYLREVLMHEFNGFWRQHLPDLKPTAGYPGDANRFYAAIRPVVERLGIPEASVWRRK